MKRSVIIFLPIIAVLLMGASSILNLQGSASPITNLKLKVITTSFDLENDDIYQYEFDLAKISLKKNNNNGYVLLISSLNDGSIKNKNENKINYYLNIGSKKFIPKTKATSIVSYKGRGRRVVDEVIKIKFNGNNKHNGAGKDFFNDTLVLTVQNV